MKRDAAVRRAADLRRAIHEHDRLYYVLARPRISDDAYDALLRELVEIERAHPDLVTPDSPTERVAGEPAAGLVKVAHVAPMLSLDSTREEAEVREFHARVLRGLGREDVAYIVEPKFDGVSIELVYADGLLEVGATRGDGRIGEEVTRNLRTMRSIPLRLVGEDLPARVAIRGEALLYLAGFQELNERLVAAGEEPFANPRNAASGAIRQLDARVTAARPLVFFAYEIVHAEPHGFTTETDAVAQLGRWGFLVDGSIRRVASLAEAIAYHAEIRDQRESLPYEIDGVVFKVDTLADHATLGMRTRSPRWALAFKFAPREDVTVVERVVISVGRTGKLTPVALLRPVSLGGVTIARATLHNEDEVRRKDVRVGDTVRVRRAGDVIPEVAEVLLELRPPDSQPFEMPSCCPACQSAVAREGAYHLCVGGYDCPAQVRGLLQHYGAKGAMNIDGLGERTVALLLDAGLVREPADLYRLRVADLAALERFAEKSAENLVQAIAATKRPRLDRLLFALGIPLIGSHVARVLAQAFGDLDGLGRATEAELLAVHEIGPEVARAVLAYFANEGNRVHLARLREAGVEPIGFEPPPKAAAAHALAGKKVVFTGELATLTRDAARALAEARGARVSGSVSKGTHYVVAGADAGSKLVKARELGVSVLTEEEFLALAGPTDAP